MNVLKSIRIQLSLWFIGSLITLSLFFYYGIHIFMLPYGEVYFVLLITLLGLVGLWLIYGMTKSLTKLTQSIQSITTQNLTDRIEGIHYENEIGQLASAFNSLLDRINQAFERERQFIGDVAHELKTPLAVLSGTLENALAKDRTNKEYLEALTHSLEESKRLSATFNNLLDLAWVEAPQHHKKPHKINLSELLTDVAEIAQGLAQPKEIKIVEEIAPGISCNGYKDKLARAIINLVDNAVKFSPNQGTVTIRLMEQSGRAIIHVEDQGPGVAVTETDKIFERFYRSSKTNNQPGTGLGLSLTKSIIKLHQGHIFVGSNQPTGSIFTITLPHA